SGRAPDDAGMEELRRKLRVRDDQMETTGLINVHRRIQLVFGQESGITLERSALGGLKVTILIMRGPKKS
ncbi:two-component sensor histidine kinase, partial [Paenibacillus sepulcri]|nr:two-component sensor histidine kinase [Paenibacillus sepulcri]